MTDRESEFARKLTRCLDRGVADMRSGTVYRLQQARATAMAAAASRITEVELATAGVGGASGSRFRPGNAPMRWAGVALLLAAVGFGYQQWHTVQQVREFEELDLHLLASDLPIDAYLDRGFQNWLRTAFDY
jgi:lysozyme family protein